MESDAMEALCRLCVEGAGDVVSIEGGVGDRINSCLPVKVDSSDDLPHNICKPCLLKVDTFYEFANTCKESERRLIRMIRGETATATSSITKPTYVKQEEVDVAAAIGKTEVTEAEEESKSYLFQQRFVEEEESASLQAPSRSEDDDDDDDDEEELPPPPKRAKRTAALKAAIALDQNSDDDLDDDMGDAHTKTEDQTDDSDDNFLVMPSTSGACAENSDQPGPSTVAPSAAAAKSSGSASAAADPVEAPPTDPFETIYIVEEERPSPNVIDLTRGASPPPPKENEKRVEAPKNSIVAWKKNVGVNEMMSKFRLSNDKSKPVLIKRRRRRKKSAIDGVASSRKSEREHSYSMIEREIENSYHLAQNCTNGIAGPTPAYIYPWHYHPQMDEAYRAACVPPTSSHDRARIETSNGRPDQSHGSDRRLLPRIAARPDQSHDSKVRRLPTVDDRTDQSQGSKDRSRGSKRRPSPKVAEYFDQSRTLPKVTEYFDQSHGSDHRPLPMIAGNFDQSHGSEYRPLPMIVDHSDQSYCSDYRPLPMIVDHSDQSLCSDYRPLPMIADHFDQSHCSDYRPLPMIAGNFDQSHFSEYRPLPEYVGHLDQSPSVVDPFDRSRGFDERPLPMITDVRSVRPMRKRGTPRRGAGRRGIGRGRTEPPDVPDPGREVPDLGRMVPDLGMSEPNSGASEPNSGTPKIINVMSMSETEKNDVVTVLSGDGMRIDGGSGDCDAENLLPVTVILRKNE